MQAETADVSAVVDLLSQRRFRKPHGMITWTWNALSPFFALALAWNIVNGDLLWGLVCGFLLATVLRLNRLTATVAQATAAFNTYEDFDKRWIGALIEALEWPDRRVQAVARIHLTRLLPELTDGETALLTEDQRAGLYYKLTPYNAARHPEFVIAILKALPHIGEAEALHYVERLTRLRGANRNKRQVRKAAQAYISLLENHVEPEIIAQWTEGVDYAQNMSDPPLRNAAETANPQTQVDERQNEAPPVQIRKREEQSNLKQPGMRIPFLIASWCVIVPYMAFQAFTMFAQRAWLEGLGFSSLTLLGTQLYRLTLTQKHRWHALSLAKTDDVREIGSLTEKLDWPDPEIRDAAMRALTHLLPRLKASDSSLLNAKQRASLYHMLDMTNAHAGMEFLIATLRALEQVGDKAAVPFVERLASTQPYSKAQKRVQQQAMECLPYLMARADQNQMSQTLLRASAGESTPADLLLRPSVESVECAKEQLLRSAD